MTPAKRNVAISEALKSINNEGMFFLKFIYDEENQVGRCDCIKSGFARIPAFAVIHKHTKTVINFLTHHGDVERVVIINNNEELFYIQAKTNIMVQLEKHSGDFN